jgi:type I restriction enzyme M protein
MIKSTDVPKELKDFTSLFNDLTYATSDYSGCFSDFMLIAINFFGNMNWKQERDDHMKRYTSKQHQIFNKMFAEMMLVYNQQIVLQGLPWYDFFGTFYEVIISNYKQSAMGQYFTPEPICTFMAQILISGENKGCERVSEPACGSGRMVMAANAERPGMLYYCVDNDFMCCQMTVLNMFHHGMVGEVVWKDALNLNDWKYGWQINPYLWGSGLPTIEPLQKQNSFLWNHDQQQLRSWEVKKVHEEVEKKEAAIAETPLFSGKPAEAKPEGRTPVDRPPVKADPKVGAVKEKKPKPSPPGQLSFF